MALIVSIGPASGDDRRLQVVLPSATTVFDGLEARAAGVKVGEITGTEVDGDRARLELTIHSDRVWPLPEGTKAFLRWAGNVSFGRRYIELTPGDPDRPDLASGAVIEGEDATVPVEIDQILGTLPARERKQLGLTIDRGGQALGVLDEELQLALERAPQAFAETEKLLADLGDDPDALETLIGATDKVVREIDAAEPGVRPLLADLGTTFDAIADEADQLESALRATPRALTRVRTTLASADGTLRKAETLTEGLGGGIGEVKALAPPTTNVLRRLVRTGPIATRTLRTLKDASPDLRRLFARLQPISRRSESLFSQAREQLECIRPYAPEVAGFASTWIGFLASTDNVDSFGRIHAQSLPYHTGMPLDSEGVVDTFGLAIAFPRPPGLNSGDPWFLPECGVGPETVDPSQDPENDEVAQP